MAQRQRGETTAPSKTTKNGKEWVEHFELTIESSDDEVPEEVTFEESKAQALEIRQQALDTARREKEQLKEKRRRKQELFQEQKKRKLLPTDVLEEIDSAHLEKQEQPEAAEEEQQEEGEEEEQHSGKKKRSRKRGHSRNLKGNYTVATLKVPLTESYQRQAAEDFIRSRLYGPGSCRTTSNELLSLENKKGKNKSAAVQFVKKDWACKEKAKSEKLKKRWIHKQKIPSR